LTPKSIEESIMTISN